MQLVALGTVYKPAFCILQFFDRTWLRSWKTLGTCVSDHLVYRLITSSYNNNREVATQSIWKGSPLRMGTKYFLVNYQFFILHFRRLLEASSFHSASQKVPSVRGPKTDNTFLKLVPLKQFLFHICEKRSAKSVLLWSCCMFCCYFTLKLMP